MKHSVETVDVTGHINAGGRGTRLVPALPDLNHPELGIAKAGLIVGRERQPLFKHHIDRQLKLGFASIVAAVGNQVKIRDLIVDRYASEPRVAAVVNPRQSGTGGDLLVAIRQHPEHYRDDIMISNVDTLVDIDTAELLDAHRSIGTGLTIALTQLRDVPNQDAFMVSAGDRVLYSAEASSNTVSFEEANSKTAWRGSSTGVVVASKEFLGDIRWVEEDGPLSLYNDIIGTALAQSALSAYDNGDKLFLDVGTIDTWRQIQDNPQLVLQSTI